MKNVQPLYAQASKPDIESLFNAYLNRDAVIGVIGMGYVGIPLICAACDIDFKSIGFDIDKEKIKSLNNGKINIYGLQKWLGVDVNKLN